MPFFRDSARQQLCHNAGQDVATAARHATIVWHQDAVTRAGWQVDVVGVHLRDVLPLPTSAASKLQFVVMQLNDMNNNVPRIVIDWRTINTECDDQLLLPL